MRGRRERRERQGNRKKGIMRKKRKEEEGERRGCTKMNKREKGSVTNQLPSMWLLALLLSVLLQLQQQTQSAVRECKRQGSVYSFPVPISLLCGRS